MPMDGFNFRSGEVISQQRGIFAVRGHFRSPFRSYEIRGGCEMALVCQRVVSQLRNLLWNGSLAAKIGVLKLWGFRSPFRSYEMREGLRNGTHVPRGGFAATKNFAEGGIGLWNHFAANGRFRSQGLIRIVLLGVSKLFRSQGPFSQGLPLGCEISQAMNFPLLLNSF